MPRQDVDKALLTKSMIIDLRKNNPEMTGAEIGRTVHVSREYVRQILKMAGLSTRKKDNHPKCPVCGKRVVNSRNKHCSKECHHIANSVKLKCHECGEYFYRIKSQWKYGCKTGKKRYFCNITCLNKWRQRGQYV